MVPAIVRTEPVPTPKSLDRLERALTQPRMGRQAEVVVRREVDDRLVIDRGVRFLLVVENPQLAIQLLLLQGVELGSEIGERIEAHSVTCEGAPPERRG